MRLQVGEGLRAPTRAVAQDPRHRQGRVVMEDRAWHPAEKGEGADMAVQDGNHRAMAAIIAAQRGEWIDAVFARHTNPTP